MKKYLARRTISAISLLLATGYWVAACAKGNQHEVIHSEKEEDSKDNDPNSGDEAAQTPVLVTGTYLADYDNARIRCDYLSQAMTTFKSTCVVVVAQKDGSELKAVGIKAGVSLAWNPPVPTLGDPSISGCLAGKDLLSYTCDIDNKTVTNIAEIHYELKIADKSRGERAEGADLLLPFSVGIAAGFVPSVPYQYAGQTSSNAKLNLADGGASPVKVGFQNFTYPASSIPFMNPTAVCSQGNRVFFLHVNFIYVVQNGQVSLYVGSMSDGNLENMSNRLRINITPISLACGKNAIYVGSEHYCRIYKVTDNDPPEPLIGKDCDTPSSPDGVKAKDAAIGRPGRIVLNSMEEVVFVDHSTRIRKITRDGLLQTLAGSTATGYAGDGGPAASALFTSINSLILDTKDNIYITDYHDHVVRKIGNDGIVKTIAGTGSPRYQNMQDTLALSEPVALALDNNGMLYIGELYRGIKQLTPDGRLVAFDTAGPDLDVSANALVKASDATTINTLGNRPAFGALHFGANGTLYRDDPVGLMKYDAGSSQATEFVGTHAPDHDCQAQVSSARQRLYEATALTYAADNSIIVGDWKDVQADQVVLFEIAESAGKNFMRGKYGCDDPALFSAKNLSRGDALQINSIGQMALAADGAIYWSNIQANRIIKIAKEGTSTAFAGDGQEVSAGDGGPAGAASIKSPLGLAFGKDGSLFVAESGGVLGNPQGAGGKIRKISPFGIITTVAGTGEAGDDGDKGPALKARLRPASLAVDGRGRLFIADFGNNKIKMVTSDGIIKTIAGGGSADISDHPAPASSVAFNQPLSIAVTNDGIIYAVTDSNVIRLTEDADGGWQLSRFWGGKPQGDCGTGRYLEWASADKAETVIKNSLAVICQGTPQTIVVKDSCPAPGGATRVAFSQMFNGFANIVEIVNPCGTL